MAAHRLNRIAAVAANTFRETVRERVLYNLVLFAVLMTFAGTMLSQLSLREDDKIVKDLGLASMELFGTLIAVFIGVGLVSKEIERRSLYPLLAKPLGRGEFLLGKFAGLACTLFVNVAAMTLGLWLTLGKLELGLLQAIAPLYFGLLLVVAIAVLFSTLTSSTLAAVCAFALTLAGRYADVLRNASVGLEGQMPGWFAQVSTPLYWLLPNLRHFDVKDRVVHGATLSAGDLGFIAAYGTCSVLAYLWLAYLSFRRREFL